MKSPVLTLLVFLFINEIKAQAIAINHNGALPKPDAILDVNATNKGLLIPRVKLIDNNNPVHGEKTTGLMVWNDTTTYKGRGFYWWNGQAWQSFGYFAGEAVKIDSVNNIHVLPNSVNQPGYVAAPGTSHKNSTYQTDNKGNPKWVKENLTMYYIEKL
jgi:hypothetical protein